MSVTVTKTEGVTVITLASDSTSISPPLCQILKGLCYSPKCCTVSHPLKQAQRTSQSLLGTLHIMVGLLNIGLGVILLCSSVGPFYVLESSGFPFWLGGLFILFGIMCIVSEKYPIPCLVILNVILNIAGVAFAIAAIVLYSINLANIYLWWICHGDYYYDTPPPVDKKMLERCEDGVAMIDAAFQGINGLLIVLSTLELCVSLSSAILGVKALCGRANSGDKSVGDPEMVKPLLEEVTA